MVRFWFMICAILPMGVCGYSQDTLKVRVRPVSTLEIHGKTNINTFTCKQTHQAPDLTQVDVYKRGKELRFEDARLIIPVKAFDCGHKIMTKDFQEILEADKKPDLLIILHSVVSEHDKHLAEVTIQIAGSSQRYRIPIEVVEHARGMTGIGERQVRFGEFNLEPPVKFMGMVKVKEELDISFNIRINQIK